MKEQPNTSIEAWTLLALIYRDLDDKDYRNALFLAERLYAINNQNTHYVHIYANCLFHLLDYSASYTVLKTARSIPCLNLFAKSCYELGNLEESNEKQRFYWEEGSQALRVALSMDELPEDVYWGDELASAAARHHMPSKASLCNLLGDLYVKLDNIRAAAIYYWECLKQNPYKISAYTKLCDIAPDCIDFNAAKLPEDIFTDFELATTDLSKSPHSYFPPRPSADVSEINFSEDLTSSSVEWNSFSVPDINNDYQEITVGQLRALVRYSPKVIEDDDELLHTEYERGDLEIKKNTIIDSINHDIRIMKAGEAYKNKHGLHKRPPVETTQKLKVELTQLDDDGENDYEREKDLYESIHKSTPPRVAKSKGVMDDDPRPNKKLRSVSSKVKNQAIDGYFFFNGMNQYTNLQTDESIINGMNKVLQVLCIIANGYVYQSFYHCEKAALELQKLDDPQYNSARVLCILGKAYYDAGDYQSARAFFKQAFVIAPWYCDGVPTYSTCLWFLEKEKELNVLAYKMKDNRSHLFEAYIAAGNWTKCATGSNEATQWFQKAVKLDPTRSYAHALLGYEEWEKGNSLGAKQHFAKSMIANKRSYIGWYGMATAYQGMEEYVQAKTLLFEAIRLHPRHPVLLATMAEVLYELEEYSEAVKFIEKSLAIRVSTANEKLKEKIIMKLEIEEAAETPEEEETYHDDSISL
ncbi:hypothetical protein INT48_006626 [Thamnidium elegans]|uniref:TPR-like protein n=1 Tax=Thamnidium elegans TaxID=101142 RepID=A0A8H7SZS8_9FUNG|nr:hypothetical protein INT48_006626 [Thamnidium elegans]